MAMNGSRFRAIWNNMNPALQKVYSGVPESNIVSHSAIHAELARKGLGRDLHNTQGCLNSLVKLGVIAEPERGYFTRVEIRGAKTPVPDTWDDVKQENDDMPQTAMAQALTAAQDTPDTPAALMLVPAMPPKGPTPVTVKGTDVPVTDPIDRLTKITAALRALADDIETTALDFAEQLNSIEEKTKKLEQLRALLKGALE